MKKYIPILLVIILILSACTSQTSQLSGKWKLIAYGPLESMTPAIKDVDASLTFGDDGTVTGSGGCNSLGGKYDVKDKQITFEEVTSTLMACDEAVMTQEAIVTQVLTNTAEFEIEDQTLAITNNGMVLVLSAVSSK
jgi:heat shock protein HslJ